MSRRLEKRYTFTPGIAGAGTVSFPGRYALSNILLITNITDGIIIFNFAEQNKKGVKSWTQYDPDFPNSIDGTTTITLAYDTSTMSSEDELQIFLEEPDRGVKIRPYDIAIDAVERIRVSNPQSLIDADFEYGLQLTKWQQIGLNRNIPSFYEVPGADLTVSDVSSDGATPFSTITVTFASGAPAIGTPLSVFGTEDPDAEGLFLILTSNGSTQVTYQARAQVPTGTIYTPYTVVKLGAIFQGAALPLTAMSSDGVSNNSTLTITFSTVHGLTPGSPVAISDSTAGTQAWEGNYFTNEITNGTTIKIQTGKTITAGTITITNVRIYAKNDSFFIHRPFDGGVLIGTYWPIHGLEAKRQSKRYFRYQSGKGIWFSTGALFCPIFDLQNVTYDSITDEITVTVQIPHVLQVGAKIRIYGVASAGYDGDYVVKTIVSATVFKVDSNDISPTVATGQLTDQPRMVVTGWYGTCVRSGVYDDTNGLFWEYDGQELYVVRRSSTYQLAGFVEVTNGSNTVIGTNTRFLEQLYVGVTITIRGQSYKVSSITSNTVMSVSPEYRGVSDTGIKPTIVKELRVPRSQFNGDVMDGDGPSGYEINLAKMQMVGIQYAWYGAGTADFVLRGPLGEYITCHRFPNNNINDEAYMRSGNLPSRYEVINEAAISKLAEASGTSGNLVLEDGARFPSPGVTYPGYVMITSNQSGTIFHEIMSFTGKVGNVLTGTTRATNYTQFVADANRVFGGATVAQNHPAGSSVILINTNCSPTISHWGSALIVDGNFDEDRGYLFNLAFQNISIPANTTRTVLLFRQAPSVSNTISGLLGEREVINRSQLLLKEIEVTTNQSCEVAGVLNPNNIPIDTVWTSATTLTVGNISGYQPSFAQYNTTFTGSPTNGELLFRFNIDARNTTVSGKQDLTTIKELNNSVVGGNFTYPDGPEVLTIIIANRTTNSALTASISLKWTEAQA
jgi:hypothetical protein